MHRPHRTTSSATGLTRALTAPTVVAVLAAGFLAASAPSASADIARDIRNEQARLDALNTQAEAAAERYNAGRIALAAARQRADLAAGRLAHDAAALDALRGQASGFAAQAYEGTTDTWAVILSSPSGPADVLDRMSSLNRIAQGQSDLMAQLATARHRQAAAAADAKAAEDAAAGTLTKLNKDKAAVLDAAHQAQSVLQDLQAKQAALIQAAKDAAARRAAQARAAALAAQAQANAAAAAAFASAQNAPSQVSSSYRHYSGSAAQIALQVAKDQLGKPYEWGAAGPDTFDCSGLTMFAYGRAGISLPHYTGDQWNAGRHVSEGELVPGDLIFFGSDLHHMGMYVGNGNFIHAPHTGDVVKISSLSGYYQDNYAGAVRVAG